MSTAWPTATAHRHRGLSHRATLSAGLAARAAAAAAVAAVTGSGSSGRGGGGSRGERGTASADRRLWQGLADRADRADLWWLCVVRE